MVSTLSFGAGLLLRLVCPERRQTVAALQHRGDGLGAVLSTKRRGGKHGGTPAKSAGKCGKNGGNLGKSGEKVGKMRTPGDPEVIFDWIQDDF